MNLGYISVVNKSGIYCTAKPFFIFKNRSVFQWSNILFHNAITYVTADRFSSISWKQMWEQSERDRALALFLLAGAADWNQN